MIAKLIFDNCDREDVRIIISALRDKRDQMLDTAQENKNSPAGAQAHRMATMIEEAKRVYDSFPMPRCTAEFQ